MVRHRSIGEAEVVHQVSPVQGYAGIEGCLHIQPSVEPFVGADAQSNDKVRSCHIVNGVK